MSLITIQSVIDSPQVDASDAELCTYHHPQWPYHGGGSCSASCVDEQYMSPSWDLRQSNYPDSFSDEFVSSYRRAAEMLNETIPEDEFDLDIEGMHMSLDYFCCYDPYEIRAIQAMAESFEWPSVDVKFEKLICTVNFDDERADLTELMLVVDEQSQNKLLPLITQFEQQMADTGVLVHVPRSENIRFHVTLAKNVNQKEVDLATLIAQINADIEWAASSTTMFQQPSVLDGWPQWMS